MARDAHRCPSASAHRRRAARARRRAGRRPRAVRDRAAGAARASSSATASSSGTRMWGDERAVARLRAAVPDRALADAQGHGAVPVAALSRAHDGRARQRPLRPAAWARTPTASSTSHDDFVAVLDAVGVDRVALVGISATAMTALRLAAEQPQRVSARDHRRRLRRFAGADRGDGASACSTESELLRARLAGLPRLLHVVHLQRAALDQALRGRRALRLGHRAAR